ncbi:MAG: hypothetical protein RIR89_1252 [Actinomycetota bacterium]
MYSFSSTCMGTGFVFQIEDEGSTDSFAKLCNSALEILQDADQRFSLYKDDSEISLLLRHEADWSNASHQQQLVLAEVEDWKTRTQGFFDAREHSADYDPSGYVKAWATQNAANYLLANGVRKFTINAGGDVYLSPDLTSPLLNRVGLSNLKSIADEGSGANLVLDLINTQYRAVATSGISERGEHIWRKDQNKELVQVSVVGKDLLEADIWATAIISGGMEAWNVFLAKTHQALTAIAITRDGQLFSAPGFVQLLARV